MKKITSIFIILLLIACDTDQVPDCIRRTGKTVTQTYEVAQFNEIMTYNRIQLFITDGPQQEVTVETGKNLLKDIGVSVKNGRLELRDGNSCNLVRGYQKTKVHVTSPNLTYIQNGSQYDLESLNTLHYPNLDLVSEDYQDEGIYHTSGRFKLKLNSKRLTIVNNFLSNYELSGKTDFFKIGIYAGDARIDATNLKVDTVQVHHRGSNDLILKPQKLITGELLSTGNVILLHSPDKIDIEEKYKGALIIKED